MQESKISFLIHFYYAPRLIKKDKNLRSLTNVDMFVVHELGIKNVICHFALHHGKVIHEKL